MNIDTSIDEDRGVRILASGASISLVGKFLGHGLHILGQVILARLLGPLVFGLYSIGMTMLRMVGILSPLGLDKGVIAFGSRYWQQDDAKFKGVLLQSLGIGFLSGMIIGSALFLLAPWLSEAVFKKPDLVVVFRWIGIAFPLMNCLRIAAAAMRITQRMKYSVLIEDNLQPALELIIIVALGIVGWRLLAGLASIFFSYLFTALVSLYIVIRIFPAIFSPKTIFNIKEILIFSLPASSAGLFTVFIIWIDRLVISIFLSSSDVGIYQAASQTSIFFSLVISGFSSIFIPMIADLYHRNDIEQLKELYRVSTKWGIYLAVPVMLVVLLFSQECITILFGKAYIAGGIVLVILSSAQFIHVAAGAVGPLMVMTGHQNRWFTLSGLMLLISIILNVILVPRWGLVGASCATAFALNGLFIWGTLDLRKLLGLWPFDRRYIKGVVAMGVTISGLLILRMIGINSLILNLSLAAFLSLILFGGILLLFGLDTEDVIFINLIKSRLSALKIKG